MNKYLTKRVTTNKNLIIKSGIASIILPPILIDLDIYDEKDDNKYLNITKLINVNYELNAYNSEYDNALCVYIDSTKPINRNMAQIYSKDNTVVIEYPDLYITMSSNVFKDYFKEAKSLVIPYEVDVELDRTFNSKLVVILKEDSNA